MFEAALGTAFALFIVLSRFNLRRICGYATVVDVVATTIFVLMFSGTYAGMMTGILAGAAVSLTLNILRKMYGYDRVSFIRMQGNLLPSAIWIHTPGRVS